LLLLEAFCLALKARRTVSALRNRLRCRAAVSKTAAHRGQCPGASVRSQSTTHHRLVTKVDSSSGSEVAARQRLAESRSAASRRDHCTIRCTAGPAALRGRSVIRAFSLSMSSTYFSALVTSLADCSNAGADRRIRFRYSLVFDEITDSLPKPFPCA